MRLATLATPDGLRLHVRARSGYVDVFAATGRAELSSMTELLRAGPAAFDTVRSLESGEGRQAEPDEFAAAVPEPGRILCLGVNYRDHAEEAGRQVPAWPECFVRGTGSVTGPFADLVRPSLTERFDYEGELGLVIGAGGRYIPAEKALDAIAGYVVLNDATARDWQRAATQWTPGKNFRGIDADRPGGRDCRRGRRVRPRFDDNSERGGHAVGPNLADDRQHSGNDRIPSLRSRPFGPET